MRPRLRRLGMLGDGARAEAAKRAQAVIHDDGARGGEIEREGGGDAHQMLAARGKLGRERAALGAEHIGRAQRVWKTRQIVRLLQNLDPDQATAFRQSEIGEAPPMIKREMRPGLRRVVTDLDRGLVGADGEDEARAEGMRRAQKVAEIDGLRDALDADGEIAAGSGK